MGGVSLLDLLRKALSASLGSFEGRDSAERSWQDSSKGVSTTLHLCQKSIFSSGPAGAPHTDS